MILWDLHNNVWLDIYSEVVRTALKEKLSADTSSTCYFTAGATLPEAFNYLSGWIIVREDGYKPPPHIIAVVQSNNNRLYCLHNVTSHV